MKTDWDSYYEKPIITSSYSRRIVQKILINLIARYTTSPENNLLLAEFGGANSCFFDAIQEQIKPKIYFVVDNNKKGLDKLSTRTTNLESVKVCETDILNLAISDQFDLTFSIGLIEHFNPHDTAQMVMKHFTATKPGGIVILSFPTPTFLYRITRFFAEKLGLWIFHDERPLLPEEVMQTIKKHGHIFYSKTIWPIFLTQHIIVAKKFD